MLYTYNILKITKVQIKIIHVITGFHSGDRVGFERVSFGSRLNFGSVINQMRVTAGHIRVGSVSHDSVEDQLFELSGLQQFGVG